MPDWGGSPSWQPSSSANLDDEAVAKRLQEQYNREVDGGAGVSSLEDESLAVARQLQVDPLSDQLTEATNLDSTDIAAV